MLTHQDYTLKITFEKFWLFFLYEYEYICNIMIFLRSKSNLTV